MNKQEVGICGSSIADTDTNGNDIVNCKDLCPMDVIKSNPRVCSCPEDINSDADGTMECKDLCHSDSMKMELSVCRCNVPDTDSNGFGMPDCIDTC